jgi:hypothetical protein
MKWTFGERSSTSFRRWSGTEQILAEEEQRVIVQAFDAIERAVVGPGIHERLLAKLAELEGR